MFVSSIFLVLAISITTASIDNKLLIAGCLNIYEAKDKPCNGSFHFGKIIPGDGHEKIMEYRILLQTDSTSRQKYNFSICFNNCSDSDIFRCSEKRFNQAKDIEDYLHFTSESECIHFVITGNISGSASFNNSCCLYFPVTNDTLPDAVPTVPNVPDTDSHNHSEHLFKIIILIVIVCCLVIISIITYILCRHQKPKPEVISIGPSISIICSDVCEKPSEESQFLFMYDSDSKSFQKTVLLFQGMIETTKKAKVTDPHKELLSIGSIDPNRWLSSHIRENTKVVIFLNAKIMKYMKNTTTGKVTQEVMVTCELDPFTELMYTFFRIFRLPNPNEQLIYVCMENEFIPDDHLKMSRLYQLPSHFKELIKDLEMCMDDETITIQRNELLRHYAKYVSEITTV